MWSVALKELGFKTIYGIYIYYTKAFVKYGKPF